MRAAAWAPLLIRGVFLKLRILACRYALVAIDVGGFELVGAQVGSHKFADTEFAVIVGVYCSEVGKMFGSCGRPKDE